MFFAQYWVMAAGADMLVLRHKQLCDSKQWRMTVQVSLVVSVWIPWFVRHTKGILTFTPILGVQERPMANTPQVVRMQIVERAGTINFGLTTGC